MWENSFFNKWCWDHWICTCKIIKLDPYLTPCITVNSRWIKDLNVRVKIIKLLEENLGVNPYNLGLGDYFLAKTAKAQATKEN